METPTYSRLISARKAAGLTQQQLGMALGMELNTVRACKNQYEKGKHVPDFLTMKRIAKELDVPVAYFYYEEGDSAEIICALGKVDATKRNEILKHLREVIERER